MFGFARRPEPQRRRPIGAPGITEEQYERSVARLRAERSARPTSAGRRLSLQPTITITEGNRP